MRSCDKDEGKTYKNPSRMIFPQLIYDRLLGIRFKKIHTHIQLIHDRNRIDHNYHIFITRFIPS
jgi:hypothetical protein